MRLLTSLVAGAVVPHAPVLIPEASPGYAEATETIRAALQRIEQPAVDIVVVLSPHGRTSGVYGHAAGSLAPMGIPAVSVDLPTAGDRIERLAERWAKPVLEEGIDHGAFVPLYIMKLAAPVVVATLAECTEQEASSLDEVLDDARSFTKAFMDADLGRVLFVASANTSAGLTARAPLTKLPAADGIEGPTLRALEIDPGALDELAPSLVADGGSCSAGPLAAVGRLFQGGRGDLVAYERPFGVGYPVVLLTP